MSYEVTIMYEPCRFASLNGESVKLEDMITNARDITMQSQTFEDVRDTRCISGDITECCGERVYELVSAD